MFQVFHLFHSPGGTEQESRLLKIFSNLVKKCNLFARIQNIIPIFVTLHRQQTYRKRFACSVRVNLDNSLGYGKSANAYTGYKMGYAHAIAESVSISLLIRTQRQSRAYFENKIRGSRFLL